MEKKLRTPYDELISTLLESLKRSFKLVSLVVYGSVARNEAWKESDIDLLLVLENLEDRYKAFKLFESAEKEVEKSLKEAEAQAGLHDIFQSDYQVESRSSLISPLYLDMIEDGIILYDKDNFFHEVLRRLRTRLEELGAEKIRVGKKWYWRLKRDYKFGDVIEIE